MKKVLLTGIGADPEFFLYSNVLKTHYPSVGILGGDKDDPIAIKNLGEGFAYLEDNVMCEYNIPPAKNASEFSNSVAMTIREVISQVNAYTEQIDGVKLDLVPDFSPSVRFKEEYLLSEQAKEFGCLPDTNAYTLEQQTVSATDAGNLRTAGGHIHIGWENCDPSDYDTAAGVAKAFDILVTLPLMLMEPENERRSLYGQAGSIRFKPYGVECRTPSSWWQSSIETMEWIFNSTVNAVNLYNEIKDELDLMSDLSIEIEDLIEKKDPDLIRAFMKENHKRFNFLPLKKDKKEVLIAV